MPPLAELQACAVRAIVTADPQPIAQQLFAPGADAVPRFAIHLRHYEASLAAALRQKFPATAWLVGEGRIIEGARAYAHAHPPSRPCIAEYGGDFPAFLARRLPALAYLKAFMELEWFVGQAAVAVAHAAVPWAAIARSGPDSLADAVLTLQPGLRYLRCAWPLDALMRTYLSSAPAERFVLRAEDSCIEVRGARGALDIVRVRPATLAFRGALRAGAPISQAAYAALDEDPTFDAGAALRATVDAGLVTAISLPSGGPTT